VAETYHFKYISNLGQHIIIEVVKQWNTVKEVDIVLQPLESCAHHNLLEYPSVKHPHLGV
jgi:hypothetical protein